MIKKTLTEEQWCVRSHNWSELRWAKNSDLFIFYIILFIYILFFWAVPGLCCWVGFSTVAASRDFSLVVLRRLLSSGSGPSCCSFQAPEHRLTAVAPAACGIFPDHSSNPCLLHCQADSLPLSHYGSLDLLDSHAVEILTSWTQVP